MDAKEGSAYTVRMANEARRSPRRPHDSVLELYDEKGGLIAGAPRLIDVSSVGASFSSTRSFAEGAAIRGRMRLLDAGVMEVTGRVVRVKKRTNSTLYAVEFDSLETVRPI